MTPAEKIKRCGLFSSSGRSSQMASTLTLVLFQRVLVRIRAAYFRARDAQAKWPKH